MRLIFMGTPAAAVPALRRCLEDGHDIVSVWTQPDRPLGRKNKITIPPIKEFALGYGLVVHQPATVKTSETKALFAGLDPDLGVIVAYGQILPGELLRVPRLGCINLHFSLLPRYRGAAPVNWAILNGEPKTGVTTMLLDEGVDSGPILLQRETPIYEDEAALDLTWRLATIGAELLSETIAQLSQIAPRPQDDQKATFAPMVRKEDGLINWSAEAIAIERCIRGFQPWPNAYTNCRSRHLIIRRAVAIKSDQKRAAAGEILAAHGDELVVKCGEETALRLAEVQPEGKRRMGVRDFLNGTRLRVGDRLG